MYIITTIFYKNIVVIVQNRQIYLSAQQKFPRYYNVLREKVVVRRRIWTGIFRKS